MIIRTIRRTTAVLLVAALTGCATVNPNPDYDRLSEVVRDAVGQPITFRPDQDPAIQQEALELIDDGLTADEAVRVALLNNPRIWAAMLRTGMARADVVQARLFSNPTLGLAFMFPEGGGLAQFDMGLAQNIADLWMIPARTNAAQHDLERALLEAARESAEIANGTSVAYYNAVATHEANEISQNNLKLVEHLLDVTRSRQEAGAVGELDVNLVRGLVLRAQVEVRNARLARAAAKRTLATLMGVARNADDLQLIDPLPEPTTRSPDPERMVDIARLSRLDLRAAHGVVSAAEARVKLEYAKVFQNVEIGFQLERGARRGQPGRNILADTARASIANGQLSAPEIESRSQRRQEESQQIEAILGPSLSLTLPVFDQNQAQIAKAQLALKEADALLESLDRSVVQETRDAADRLATSMSVAHLYDEQVLPQARDTLELSEAAYQAGKSGILSVIEAQRSLLQVRQAYVAALQSAAVALVDLERATGRPAIDLLQPN